MGIFFCLRNPCLFHSLCRQPFPKGIGYGNLMESDLLVRDGRVIIREAHIGQVKPPASFKSLKIIITEAPCDLPCTVRAEVKEDHGIPILYSCHRCAVLYHHSGLYKFIRFLPVIGCLDPLRAACCRKPFPFGQGIVSQLNPVIVVIPVHGIVTPHH